jgi:hypothetical protein
MNIKQIEEKWNNQADEFNQWDKLGSDEMVEFAIKCTKQKYKSLWPEGYLERVGGDLDDLKNVIGDESDLYVELSQDFTSILDSVEALSREIRKVKSTKKESK